MKLKFTAHQKTVLRLHLSNRISLAQAHECLNHLETSAAGRCIQECSTKKIETALEAVERWRAEPLRHCVTLADRRYPIVLRSLSDPPLVLYGQGGWQTLGKPAVALVGARQCTPGASAHTFELACAIAKQGWCVVSGLARGIDTAAHRGALASGVPGSTVAVLGTGIDVMYPPENASLAHQIVDSGGLLLTEFALGSAPLARHFPQRNRIVAALSRATIVAQAALRSGSMITARLAAEMGREVLAVPGRPDEALSEGPNELIRQGAGLLACVGDLWSAFSVCAQMSTRSHETS